VQKLRKHAFDVEWRGGHFQDAHVTATEVLCPLSIAGDVIQQATTIVDQLLAFPGRTHVGAFGDNREHSN